MAMTRSAVLDRLQAIIGGLTTHYEQVLVGEPLGLPTMATKGIAAFWYDGEEAEEETFGNVMVRERLQFRAYWNVRPERGASQEAITLAMWDAVRATKVALRADSLLDSGAQTPNTTDLKLGLTDAGWLQMPQDGAALYMSAGFEIIIWGFEEDAISG